jgi:hypothetical protein
LPAGIYKTSIIDENVINNLYLGIYTMFPHLALPAKIINEEKSFYVVEKDIVLIGLNPDLKTMYNRGFYENYIPITRRLMFWSVGFFNSIELIANRKMQIEIIDNLKHFHPTLFSLFRSIVIYNKVLKNNYLFNLLQISKILNLRQFLLFLTAFVSVIFSIRDYKYWFMKYEDVWIDSFNSVKPQKYIECSYQSSKGLSICFDSSY